MLGANTHTHTQPNNSDAYSNQLPVQSSLFTINETQSVTHSLLNYKSKTYALYRRIFHYLKKKNREREPWKCAFFDIVVAVAGRRCGGCWFYTVYIHTLIGICSKGSKYFQAEPIKTLHSTVCVYAVCVLFICRFTVSLVFSLVFDPLSLCVCLFVYVSYTIRIRAALW